MPSLQNIQDVAQRRRLRRCHNPDARWQGRNRFLPLRRKQSLRLQLGLQLLERNLQPSGALRLDVLRRNLQLPAIFVNRHPSPHHHLHSVRRTKPQQPRRRPKHHHPNLRIPILQREIKMSGIRRPKVRSLALHPRVGVLPLHMRPHRRHQAAHRPHPPLRRREPESELIR